MLRFGNSAGSISLNCIVRGWSNRFHPANPTRTMNSKPPAEIHFPTARDKGPFPFPTTQSMAAKKSGLEPSDLPSQEELRLMADTMPGDGPGD
jgi:hypothetical protein